MASEDEVYSDLTELESDEEYAETTKNKGKKGAYTGWRIRNALKVPRATTYTAQALYGACWRVKSCINLTESILDQIYGCDINLEPEYQRGKLLPSLVWTIYSYIFHRRRVVRSEANRYYRLGFQELLHSTRYICCECTRGWVGD